MKKFLLFLIFISFITTNLYAQRDSRRASYNIIRADSIYAYKDTSSGTGVTTFVDSVRFRASLLIVPGSDTLMSAIAVLEAISDTADILRGDMIDSARAMIDSTKMGSIDSTDLVGYYPMDDSVTSTGTIYDYSGWGNDGTNYGMIYRQNFDSVAGGYGAVSGYGESPSGIIVEGQPTNAYIDSLNGTIGCWIIPQTQLIANAYVVTVGERLQIRTDNTKGIYGNYYDGAGREVGENLTPIVSGKKYYVVFTWNTSGHYLYINGELVDSDTQTSGFLMQPSKYLSIGASNNGVGSLNGNYYVGIIDEVMIYSRALSALEIKQLYNNSAHYNQALKQSNPAISMLGDSVNMGDGDFVKDRAGNIFLSDGTNQTFMLGRRTSSFVIQGQSSATNLVQEMFTKDGDGTDFVGIDIFGVGTISDATNNRERLEIIWNKNNSQYEIYTEEQGTGTLRPLVLYTEGNTNQLLLNTDGSVALSDSLAVNENFRVGREGKISGDSSAVFTHSVTGSEFKTNSGDRALTFADVDTTIRIWHPSPLNFTYNMISANIAGGDTNIRVMDTGNNVGTGLDTTWTIFECKIATMDSIMAIKRELVFYNFNNWHSDTALVINYHVTSTTLTDNFIDVNIYRQGTALPIYEGSRVATALGWNTLVLSASDMSSGWVAGQKLILTIIVGCKSANAVKISDIEWRFDI